MIGGKATGREVWLRLACLALSVGLHAGLGVAGWQSLEATLASEGPITVVLVEKPSAAPGSPARIAALDRRPRAKAAIPPRRSASPPPAVSPPVRAVSAEPLCVVSEATVVEEPGADALTRFASPQVSAGGEVNTDGSRSSGGAETGSGGSAQGSGRGKDAGGGEGGLIRATPRYESNPLPEYPRLARQNRWEGTARLRARVTTSGEVESVALERSSGHAALDRSALDGVQHWRFIPATRGGVPVACDVSIPVAFKLTE